jgi:hypothetical protein
MSAETSIHQQGVGMRCVQCSCVKRSNVDVLSGRNRGVDVAEACPKIHRHGVRKCAKLYEAHHPCLVFGSGTSLAFIRINSSGIVWSVCRTSVGYIQLVSQIVCFNNQTHLGNNVGAQKSMDEPRFLIAFVVVGVYVQASAGVHASRCLYEMSAGFSSSSLLLFVFEWLCCVILVPFR